MTLIHSSLGSIQSYGQGQNMLQPCVCPFVEHVKCLRCISPEGGKNIVYVRILALLRDYVSKLPIRSCFCIFASDVTDAQC